LTLEKARENVSQISIYLWLDHPWDDRADKETAATTTVERDSNIRGWWTDRDDLRELAHSQ
jgi:hypothetical protein